MYRVLCLTVYGICSLTPVFVSGQDCHTSGSVQVFTQDTTRIVITVSGLLNNDLGTNQQLCGIFIRFNHDRIENLDISLVSPAGLEIQLLGPTSINSQISALVTFSLRFTSCFAPASPDPGLSAIWDSSQEFQAFSEYTGTYYPFLGCLEDLNTGSANGNWILSVNNIGPFGQGTIEFVELIFCNQEGVECADCFLNAGAFDEEFYFICQNDTALDELLDTSTLVNLAVEPEFQSFTYLTVVGDDIVSATPGIAPSEFDAGEYTICGLVFNKVDSALVLGESMLSGINTIIDSQAICADLTTPCLKVRVLEPIYENSVEAFICDDESIMVQGLEFSGSADTTIYRLGNGVCDSVINISIEQIYLEARLADTDTVINCGETLLLNGLPSTGSVSAFEYEWLTNDGEYISNIGPIAEVASAGHYSLVIKALNCTDTVSVTITEQNDLPLALAYSDELCSGDTNVIEILNFVDFDSVLWTGPGITSEMIGQFEINAGGEYTVQGFSGDCTAVETLDIIEVNTEFVLSLDDVNCNTGDYILCISTMSEPDETMWRLDGDHVSSDYPCLSVDELGTYTAEVHFGTTCSASGEIVLSSDLQTPKVEINASAMSIGCTVEEIEISVHNDNDESAVEYSWGTEDGHILGTQFGKVIAIDEPGTYVVVAFNNLTGCTDTVGMTIDSLSSTISDIGFRIENPLCFPDTTGVFMIESVSGEGPFMYSLDDENAFTASAFFDNLNPGMHTIYIADSFGCVISETFTIAPPRMITVDLGPDLFLEEGDNVQVVPTLNFNANEVANVDWRPSGLVSCQDCLRPTISPNEDGALSLIITDIYNCSASDTLLFFVENAVGIFAPNIFSPNEDGINDLFQIHSGRGVDKILDFRILDRWGNLLFFRADFGPDDRIAEWDGSFDGQKAQPSVYVYTVKVLLENGNEYLKTGDITLIR